jgi:hypothetical protein
VKRFWQGQHHDVEAELRKYRPEPRPAFLAALNADLQERMRRPKVARRAALVTALTVGMLAVFATFGGIGYASSAANQAIHISKIERLVGVSHHTQSNHSPASHVTGDDHNPVFGDEYRPGKGCGDKNHVHFRENECKKHH